VELLKLVHDQHPQVTVVLPTQYVRIIAATNRDLESAITPFLEKFSEPQAPVRTISEDAMRRLIAYHWPGNVRELENAMERCGPGFRAWVRICASRFAPCAATSRSRRWSC